MLGGWCGWSGICKTYNRAGKFQWLLVPVQGRRDWWYELFLNQISNSLFLRSASTRINISRVLCFSKFSIVETKFGGPSLVIHHNIVPVFKFSDNVSLKTKWSKWLYLLVMWAGMILFLSPGVGHRCHCVIIANGTIITDGFLIQALSSTLAQFQRFRLKTVFVLFFTLARWA